jgi:hypothetical protein
MKRVFISFAAILFLGIFAAAFSQTVGGSIGNGTASRGGSTRGTVVISVPSGLHINSNRPNSPYAIATSVRLTASGAKIGGVSYPRGKNRKFAFSENTINVYEGRVPVGFNLRLPQNFKGDTVRVRAVVRYQACTEEVCYPPKTTEVTLTARVR